MSTQHITYDYIKFIKTFIINKCVSKYCKRMLSISNDENLHEDYKNIYNRNLEKYIYDPETWDKIMSELHTPIKYLIYLYKTTERKFNTDTENVFVMKTFQEYIDSFITLGKVGAYDYQRFIASMKDPEFKNNLVEKYNDFIFENKIKNYIVYVTKLYLSIKFNNETIPSFTDLEKLEIENFIDISPFLEFLSKRELTMNNNTVDNTNSLLDERIQMIENETINYINNNMFM